MRTFETIRCETIRTGVTELTLARPAKHNALNSQMICELTEAAELIAGDPGVRAVVLRGEGKSFCAGGDLVWMGAQFEATPERRAAEAQALYRMLRTLDELPQLTICAVEGAVFGGGLGLVSVCDVAIASANARFSLSETRLGLIPATIAPFVLRRIGISALRGIGLHGVMFDAEEAKAIGLVSAVEQGALDAAVRHHLDHVLRCAPGAVAEAKALFRALTQGAGEREAIAALVARWEAVEAHDGIAAFFAKEAPPWQT